ncbi:MULTISPECIES: APC family permease [Pseudomonadaceae]|uniref:APC family permease n=1 Tax=Pseudomonadaceae TaxID=135621 RepID=UPI00244BAA82|nr:MULTISPECIES: amino acid permease [Pseudomonadaceae]MDH0424958.1 amino acid permease [Stutzerimonas stutzeri]
MRVPSGSRGGLCVTDGVAVLVGVVVGVGIFGFPPLVAQHAPNALAYLGLWLAGGLLMLVGALCYAELGATYPHRGGEYHYLARAWGPRVALLFAWARCGVIQTGSIAAVAFIYGDYAQRLLPLGEAGAAWHAALVVTALTALNVLGTRESGRLQQLFTGLTLLAILCVSGAGLYAALAGDGAPPQPVAPAEGGLVGMLGMGMVFVLLTYGGWNEAAYLSGELRRPARDMSRVLLFGAALVTGLYLLVNLAFLGIFGLQGVRDSSAIGADLMGLVAGARGETLLALLVCVTALSTLNATVLTGARVYYALGRDVPRLAALGTWNERGATPRRALLLQAVISLGLVAFGAYLGNGIETMVAYTAPVFWLFMALVALSLPRLRRRAPVARPFSVPGYPFTPWLFALVCLGLCWASVRYAGEGALLGVAVLLAGLPLLLLQRRVPLPEPAGEGA